MSIILLPSVAFHIANTLVQIFTEIASIGQDQHFSEPNWSTHALCKRSIKFELFFLLLLFQLTETWLRPSQFDPTEIWTLIVRGARKCRRPAKLPPRPHLPAFLFPPAPALFSEFSSFVVRWEPGRSSPCGTSSGVLSDCSGFGRYVRYCPCWDLETKKEGVVKKENWGQNHGV